MTKNRLYCDDNLKILPTMEKESVDLNQKKYFFGRFFVPFVHFRGKKSVQSVKLVPKASAVNNTSNPQSPSSALRKAPEERWLKLEGLDRCLHRDMLKAATEYVSKHVRKALISVNSP